MNPQPVPDATGEPIDGSNQITYDGAKASLGYLFMTVSAHQPKTEFWPLGSQHAQPYDPMTLDLATHAIR